MASNPNPARITDAMWRLWESSRDAIGDIQLGGIYASKAGYHNTRSNLGAGDYSVTYAADKLGPSDKAAALDLTFPEAHSGSYGRIQLVTKRLVEAARARDPRIYKGSIPVIREVIGNFGGRAKAYDLYSRKESGRDDSHLWHIHLSVTRKYVTDWSVLSGLVEIMADTEGDDDVIGLKRGDSGEKVKGLQAMLSYAGFDVAVDGDYGAKTAAALLAMRKAMKSTATDGDSVTGYAYAQLQKALARAQGGEPGPAGPPGPQGPPGTFPKSVRITGTATEA